MVNNFNNIINSGYRQMLRDTAPKIVSRAKGVIPYNVVDDIIYALKYGDRTPKVGTNSAINTLIPNKMNSKQATKIIKDAIGSTTSKQFIKKAAQGMKYLPIVGSAFDIGEGLYQATHGHPYAGLLQTTLGAAGLPLSMASGGIGGAVTRVGANAVNKYLMEGAGKYLLSTPGRLTSSALVNLDYLLNNKTKSNNAKNDDSQDKNVSDVLEEFNVDRELGNNIPVLRQTYIPTNNTNTTGKSDGITDIILHNTNSGNGYNGSNNYQDNMLNNDNVNNTDTINNNTTYDEHQDRQQEQQKIDYSLALLNAIQSQEASNASNYLKSLNMYKAALPFAQRSDYYTRLSNAYKAKALNNPYIANVGSIGNVDYITTLPKISQEQASVLNNLLSSNVGRYANMQAASDAGLNPLTGLSDKSVLQQVGGIMKANTAADTKRYSADRYFEGRKLTSQTQLQIQQMKNAIQEKLLDRTLSTKERMQLRDLQTKLSIAEQRNATNLELGRMGAMSRPYTMGVGLTPEYGKLFGINYNSNVSPDVGGIDPNVINSLINR